MFALVEDGSITKYFSGNRGITIGDLQYSKQIFTLWTKAEREAIGIYEVEFDNTNKKDEQWYTNTNQSFAFAGGKITASYGSATAKAHADTKWTQAQIDDPSLVGQAPDGADTNTVRLKGLKTVLIRNLKKQAAVILQDTDWYIVRKADAGTAVPSSITNHRAAVRTKAASMETAITNASDTPALETLYTFTKQEAVTEYRFTVHMNIEWYDKANEKILLKKNFSGWGAYGLSGDISSDGIDNDGDGLIDSEDDNEFGDPREFATSVAVNKIAEDILNEIMTSW